MLENGSSNRIVKLARISPCNAEEMVESCAKIIREWFDLGLGVPNDLIDPFIAIDSEWEAGDRTLPNASQKFYQFYISTFREACIKIVEYFAGQKLS
jgi:hypothetical protein